MIGARPSLAQIFGSSGGLVVVALICALSGFLFGANRPISFQQDVPQLGLIAGYIALIFPYFYSRYAALEGRIPTPQELSDSSRTVPIVLAVALFLIFGLLLQLFVTSTEQHALVPPLAIALLPFLHLGVRMYWYASRGDEGQQQERRFKNKVLLPAFATCLVSFSFGWTLAHPVFPFISMWLPFALIAIGRELLSTRAWPWALLFVSITIVVASITMLVGHSDVGSVILVGMILTLAMGVAEVCKRVVWIKRQHRILGVLVPPEDADFYLTGSNWASAVFPLFLFLLPLLIPGLPVLPILLLVCAQYVLWHFLSGSRTNRIIVVANVILGYCLPLVFVIQHYVYAAHTSSIIEKIPLGELLEASIGFVVIYLAILLFVWHDNVMDFLRHITRRTIYKSEQNSFLLLLAVSLLLFALTVGVALVNDAGTQYFQPKAKETVVALLVLWVIVTLFRIIKSAIVGPPNMGSTSDGGELVGPENGQSRMTATRLIFSLARMPVGIIAGIPVFTILVHHGSSPPITAALEALPIVLTTMAGFALNDIYDIVADRNSTKYKPLANGDITIHVAKRFAIALCSLALLSSIVVDNERATFVILLALAGVAFYSPLAQRIPIAKGFVTAFLSCSPILYAVELAKVSVPISYFVFLSLFICGRELLLDVRDIPCDQAAGMKTLAYHVGAFPSRVLGWGLMALGGMAIASQVQGIPALLCMMAVGTLAICWLLYIYDENRGLAWSRLALLLAAAGAALAI